MLEGPAEDALTPLVQSVRPDSSAAHMQAVGHIIGMMKDPSPVVKDSVSWLLSRVVDMFPDVALSDAVFVPFVQAMLAGLEMETRVATNCCWVGVRGPP